MLTKEAILSRLPANIELDWSTYVNTSTKARFIDSKFGEWWIRPNDIFNGHGHTKRQNPEVSRNRLTEDQINARLPQGMKIDMSTFSGIHTKALFLNKEFGDFWSQPTVIFKSQSHPKNRWLKARTTTKERYGHPYPNQNLQFLKKSAQNQSNKILKNHWLSGDELICVGSYEAKVVDYLNRNKIGFEWQPQTFQTPFKTKRGTIVTYHPDLYLINTNVWVEIKGYMREDAQEKWDWFHKEYPNSELWNLKQLKNMGIL